ncbi:MAG: FAD-dependent oxidoreductase, partial [Schleiferiaceae bacterium]|nr:FAD-dependent oxidoreductase [Schleiferiaceae bacterium]
EMQRVLRKIGMVFHLGTKVVGVERKGDLVTVQATDKKGNALKFEGDYCLVAVGRRANTAGLNYEAAGLKAD